MAEEEDDLKSGLSFPTICPATSQLFWMCIEEDVNGREQLPHRHAVQAVHDAHIVGAVRFVRMRQAEVKEATDVLLFIQCALPYANIELLGDIEMLCDAPVAYDLVR
jgi:hypothetical protein